MMEISRLLFPRKMGEKEVEYTDRIAGWLDEMSINEPEAKESSEVAKEQRELLDPTTPPRRPTTPGSLEDISPTDTSFSGQSVFDTPVRSKVHSGSPTQKHHIADDSSNITSVGDETEWKTPLGKEQVVQPPPAPNFGQRTSSRLANPKLYDPSSVNEEEGEAEKIIQPISIHAFP